MNYYKQGDLDKADKIKAAFEDKGYDTTGWKFNVEGVFYYTHEGIIDLACSKFIINLIKTHPDYKELELPKPHYDISNFHAGMPVLVRDTEGRWSYVTFSHTYTSIDGKTYFNACGWTWSQCIPYNEDTKHLLGTTDPCPEEFINW